MPINHAVAISGISGISEILCSKTSYITSKKLLAKWNVIPDFISSYNYSTSLRFYSGNISYLIPSLFAPIVFYLTPPIADTFPESVISPVMAIYLAADFLKANETSVQVIATPADGPSLPISISGKFK